MKGDHEYWLNILRSNTGFDEPEKWIEYAAAHGFFRVRAVRVPGCPDCGGRASKVLGQYVYYSNLARLRLCRSCSLVYSDVHIDPAVIASHFERSYKQESYFSNHRALVFQQIARLVAESAPADGRIMDIGGAKGHLLNELHKQRPDLDCWISDLSRDACNVAEQRYGFRTVHGASTELSSLETTFDVLMMIDVAYYEPRIRDMWSMVAKLTAPSGLLIMRVPDNLLLIRLATALTRLARDRRRTRLQARVPLFNPEHVLVFSRNYIKKRLRGLGFERIDFVPSAPLRRSGIGRVLGWWMHGVHWMHTKIGWSPMLGLSILVVARRR